MNAKKEMRKTIVLCIVVVVCGLSLMGLVYILNNKPYVPITPGIVHAPSPTATPVRPVSLRTTVPPRLGYQTLSGREESHSAAHIPSASMPSYQNGLFATSNGLMHSVGGGMNGGMVSNGSSSSAGSSSRGIIYNGMSVTMPMTAFTAMASSRAVSAPAANNAPQMAAIAPRHAPGPPIIDGPLPEEHQLVEHSPVGDGLWVLIILISAYCGFIILRRSKHSAILKG